MTMFLNPVKETVNSIIQDNNSPDNFLRAIVDACVSNVAVLDESGSIIYASKAWGGLEWNSQLKNGTSPSDFESYRRFTHSELDEEANITLADDIRHILFGNDKEFHRKYHCPALIESRFFVIHAARLNLSGSIFRVLITHEEPPFVNDALRDSKERLLELLGTKILAWEGEVEGQRFTYVSEDAVEMLGYAVAEWYEPNFLASHIHKDDLHWVLAAYAKQTRMTEHFDLTFRLWASDGRLVWIQNLVSVAPESEGATKLHGFMIDVSERKRSEEALKDLGGRLIAAQEEERRRVARELHDDFNQRLAVLSLELEQLGQRVPNRPGLRSSVKRLQAQAQEIAAEIHRLSYKLHPSKLDHVGLAAAVRSLCVELTKSGKLKVDFNQTGFPAALDRDVTLCIYRIAQEGLRNCVKHSGAESARVVLTKTRNAVRLVVADNGCGFNTKTALLEKGLGFISMKERLHILGGQMNVYSKPLRGTRIEVSVPLKLKTESPRQTPNFSSAFVE
ncbi:MAG TPA: histidine kinase [Pyrinomonadaceae bacterium]|nr:histidine kinase [Pyrinomonadaceae bacterium]